MTTQKVAVPSLLFCSPACQHGLLALLSPRLRPTGLFLPAEGAPGILAWLDSPVGSWVSTHVSQDMPPRSPWPAWASPSHHNLGFLAPVPLHSPHAHPDCSLPLSSGPCPQCSWVLPRAHRRGFSNLPDFDSLEASSTASVVTTQSVPIADCAPEAGS